MKQSLRILIAFTLLSFAFLLSAQAQLKVAVVDAAKVMKEYYKTQEAETRIKEEMTKYQNELNTRRDNYVKLVDQIRTLQESVKDTTLSQEKRAEKEAALREKVKEAGMREQENKTFIQTASRLVQDQRRRANEAIMDDMSKAINAVSKASGYNLVLVKAEFPSPVLYSDVPDISPDVSRELNKNRPSSSTASTTPR